MTTGQQVSRRNFVKLSAGSTAALGLFLLNLPNFDRFLAAALAEVPVIWLQAGSCSGCSVSILNSLNPKIQDLLITEVIPGQHVSMRFHTTIMAASGDLAMQAMENTASRGSYVLVVEGAVATKDDGVYCQIGERNGQGITALEHLITLGRDAMAVLALGTCSAYGGVPAAEPNVTGIKTVTEILADNGIATPVINLPGCPPHPDWFMGTVVSILIDGLGSVEVDKVGRPLVFYGETIHDQCTRRGLYDSGHFAKRLSEPYCLYELGCKGPVTYADCAVRWWNGKTSWCVDSNAPCIGCTEPDFPDGLSPLYDEVPMESLANKVAIGLAGATVAGAVCLGAYHAITKGGTRRSQ